MEKEKPYKCEVCGKRYKNLNGLKYVSHTRGLYTASANPPTAQAALASLQSGPKAQQPHGRGWHEQPRGQRRGPPWHRRREHDVREHVIPGTVPRRISFSLDSTHTHTHTQTPQQDCIGRSFLFETIHHGRRTNQTIPRIDWLARNLGLDGLGRIDIASLLRPGSCVALPFDGQTRSSLFLFSLLLCVVHRRFPKTKVGRRALLLSIRIIILIVFLLFFPSGIY